MFKSTSNLTNLSFIGIAFLLLEFQLFLINRPKNTLIGFPVPMRTWMNYCKLRFWSNLNSKLRDYYRTPRHYEILYIYCCSICILCWLLVEPRILFSSFHMCMLCAYKKKIDLFFLHIEYTALNVSLENTKRNHKIHFPPWTKPLDSLNAKIVYVNFWRICSSLWFFIVECILFSKIC